MPRPRKYVTRKCKMCSDPIPVNGRPPSQYRKLLICSPACQRGLRIAAAESQRGKRKPRVTEDDTETMCTSVLARADAVVDLQRHHRTGEQRYLDAAAKVFTLDEIAWFLDGWKKGRMEAS